MASRTVRPLKNSYELDYRNWVIQKRKTVSQQSGGRLGYIHIPNMVGRGYAEFEREFQKIAEYSGIIVDVRYNGGGHVSQLILEHLMREPLAQSESRWFGNETVPHTTKQRNLVAICNEFTGSDGDIFTHTFKMKKLGPVVGTRTWGGVVGIWPRNTHRDGGITTQPEFAFRFNDVGYGIENFG